MKKEKYNVAVIGATGAVGEAMLAILEQRDFPVDTLYPVASHRSIGKTIRFKGKTLEVLDLASFYFEDVDIALFSAGGALSKEYAPIAAKAKCVVIDNTSCFRNEKDIPLVIPEVNPEKIADFKKRYIIANPNCSTIQMLVVLKPILDAVGLKSITISTYQSVSGAGKSAITELVQQTSELLNGRPIDPKIIPEQIAFNVVPQIDEFQENGYTREEMKMVWETHKIFEDDSIAVNPTAVRVPVFYGHSESITIETKCGTTVEALTHLLNEAPGIECFAQQAYPTPVNQATGKDEVFVGRLRADLHKPNVFNLWVVADNIRKGAALNAIQIAELLIEKYI